VGAADAIVRTVLDYAQKEGTKLLAIQVVFEEL